MMTIKKYVYVFFFSFRQVWFQNRRAKFRKQEKQLAKQMNPSFAAAAAAAAAACSGNNALGSVRSIGGLNGNLMAAMAATTANARPYITGPSASSTGVSTAVSQSNVYGQIPISSPQMANGQNAAVAAAAALSRYGQLQPSNSSLYQ